MTVRDYLEILNMCELENNVRYTNLHRGLLKIFPENSSKGAMISKIKDDLLYTYSSDDSFKCVNLSDDISIYCDNCDIEYIINTTVWVLSFMANGNLSLEKQEQISKFCSYLSQQTLKK